MSQQYYAPALAVLEKEGAARVTALMDPGFKARTELHRRFATAALVESVSGAAGCGAELAIIASPPRHHAAQTIEALGLGLSVLCEKPMATSTAECRVMMEAARATGRLLAIGMVRRHFPATQLIAEVLGQGWLGEISEVECFEGGRFEWPVESSSYFSDSTGGVLMDIGIHSLDLLLWWFGELAQVDYEDDAMGGIEVNCRVRLRFKSGVTAEVRLSRDWPRPNVYSIRGSRGWIRWEVNDANSIQLGLPVSRYDIQGGIRLRGAGEGYGAGEAAPDFHHSFLNQLRNVVAGVRGQETVRVSGETGLRAMEVIQACYQRRVLMDMPWLNEVERDRAGPLSRGVH